MSKKKGLGRDLNKSMEVAGNLLKILREFSDVPIKRGLHSSRISDPQVHKLVNDVMEKAVTLSMAVQDMCASISGAKPPKMNSRFASQRVIEKFLSL
jgi:hypothetical protein